MAPGRAGSPVEAVQAPGNAGVSTEKAGTHPLALDLLASLREVRRSQGKGIGRQLLEMAALSATGNRLSPLDYHRYQLHDDARHDWASKRCFVGDRRCHETFERTVNRGWLRLVSDKLDSAAFLEEHGFRMPRMRAVHHPTRSCPGAVHLPTDAALMDWLREAELPVFAKPLRGFQGLGALRVDGFDPDTDALTLHDGRRVSVAGFVEGLHHALAGLRPAGRPPNSGYLFQEAVAQHPALITRCGPGVGCVRAMVGVEGEQVRPFAWIWKIPAPDQPADNIGGIGNLLAAIDPDTGEVLRLSQGVGLQQRTLEANPYTGETLLGWRLPHFPEVRDTILRGAALLPEVRVQSWDVAVGVDGPVVIEVNPAGSHSVLQLATGRGLWTPEVRTFLKRAEAANPTRPRGLRRLGWTGHRLGRVDGVLRLLRGLGGPSR